MDKTCGKSEVIHGTIWAIKNSEFIFILGPSACVKSAEQYRIDNETSKTYINSAGSALFNERITALNFGDHRVVRENRVRTVSTPGGTGALRIAGELISSGDLQPVLTDYQWPITPAYAIYPPTRHLSYRVRAFIDFLAERFEGVPYWDEECEVPSARQS